MAAVSCDDKTQADPAVKLISDPVIEVPQEGGKAVVKFTSATEWDLRGLSDLDWVVADKESGAGSAEEQTITLQFTPNENADREGSLTIYASPLAKKTISISQPGAKGDGVVTMTVQEFITNASTTDRVRLTGKISGLYTSSYTTFNLVDDSGSILVYSFDSTNTTEPSTLENGGTITLTGIYAYYESKQQHEVTKAIIEDYQAPAALDPTTIQNLTVAEFITKADTETNYRLTGIISNFSSTYCSFDITDDSGSIYVYSVTSDTKTKYASVLKNGYKVTLYGLYSYYASKQQHEVISAVVESYEEVAATTEQFSGTVVAVSKFAFLVKASDGYKYVYDTDLTPTVKVGDIVTVSAEKTSYNGLTEYENYTVTTSGTETVTHPDATVLTGTALDSYATTFGYVSFSGKLTVSGNYYNVAVTGATAIGSLSNPVEVPDSLSGKIVDVEGYYLQSSGSTTKYQNIILTKIAASSDQTGADDGTQGGGSNVSLEPGEDEVLYALTSDEICAVVKTGTGAYGDLKISCNYGNWTGNVFLGTAANYLQLRAKSGACVKSPTFSTDIKRVVLAINSTTYSPRYFYLLPSTTEIPTGSYTTDLFANEYGHVTPTGGVAENLEVTFNTSAKDFTVVAYGGAAYLDGIYVFCAK